MAVENGWARLHRAIREHPSWNHDGMFKLLCHCILEANYRDSQYLVPGTVSAMIVERGSFVTGRERLRADMYPHPNKDSACSRTVWRWLQALSQMECLNLRTLSNRCTMVTVCNYGGARSQSAAEYLRQQGYSKVIALSGGVTAWKAHQEEAERLAHETSNKLRPS